MVMNWYIIHTYSGRELKVADMLKKQIEKQNLMSKFGDILVPTEEYSVKKKGKTIKKSKVLFPGYIMIEMDMNEETLSLVKNTTGVTGFIGKENNRPKALTEDEVEAMLKRVEDAKKHVIEQIPFKEGDPITVIGGPFSGFNGVVEEIYPDRGKVKVMVVVFERSTPVELDIHLVERV
jgi:transcriptional antiterminator NusG